MGENRTHENPGHLASVTQNREKPRYGLSYRGRWLLVAALLSILIWSVAGVWVWDLLSSAP